MTFCYEYLALIVTYAIKVMAGLSIEIVFNVVIMCSAFNVCVCAEQSEKQDE
jgi:hypothetical protein